MNKLNINYDNSSNEETVVLNETFIDKNLISLKNQEEIILMNNYNFSDNEALKSSEIQLNRISSRKKESEKKIINEKKTYKTQNASFFESNLDVNFSMINSRNKIYNEGNSINFNDCKKRSSNDDSRYEFVETINLENKYNHEQENIISLINPKIFTENIKSRRSYNSYLTSKSQVEKKFNYQENIAEKISSNLIFENTLDDGILIIFNDFKNKNNLHVITNINNKINFHLLNKNNSYLGNNILREEFILNSECISKIKNQILNFDINKSSIISYENIKKITNIIENNEKNIAKINKNENKNVFRILIVDDEELIRKSQINLINKYSIKKNILVEIEECEDGIECLFKIYKGLQIEKKYNLIITDETMNYIKGSFRAKILKKLIAENVVYNIRIVMVTSYGVENYSHLQDTILEKVYSKPIRINTIENILNFS